MTLTVTVEIPDDQGARLTDADIEEIRQSVREHVERRATLLRPNLPPLEVIRNMTREEAHELMRRIVPADRPVLPAEALTRESLYED